jgi:membrane associated rhomboid family serine protease
MDKKGGGNINHSAHIWGAIYGLAFIILLGRIIDFNVIAEGIERIKAYMRFKGWIS